MEAPRIRRPSSAPHTRPSSARPPPQTIAPVATYGQPVFVEEARVCRPSSARQPKQTVSAAADVDALVGAPAPQVADAGWPSPWSPVAHSQVIPPWAAPITEAPEEAQEKITTEAPAKPSSTPRQRPSSAPFSRQAAQVPAEMKAQAAEDAPDNAEVVSAVRMEQILRRLAGFGTPRVSKTDPRVDAQKRAAARKSRQAASGTLKVEGKQLCASKPSARGSHRSMKPPQAKRPSSAPGAGRRVAPYGRGLHSQLWVGEGYFPGVRMQSRKSDYPHFRLHSEEWAAARNAGGAHERRVNDYGLTQIF